ncbi:unnamed protein product [Bursaphelenchus okinawaensis]|uniref:Uncharacterized protein n=1 Tax=Bursaphelenchus okinawaensis TaxID=465554 RepID=A0A811KC70_9BILA|nr:unnamed protein product [Bursaphelenchus okinawaensis]CAG9097752.1 unnamed protein product [Bursaphelenchus okinawaensis]
MPRQDSARKSVIQIPQNLHFKFLVLLRNGGTMTVEQRERTPQIEIKEESNPDCCTKFINAICEFFGLIAKDRHKKITVKIEENKITYFGKDGKCKDPKVLMEDMKQKTVDMSEPRVSKKRKKNTNKTSSPHHKSSSPHHKKKHD